MPSLQQGIDLRVRAWYNADLESRNFYLPGVVAFMILLLSMLLTCMAIVSACSSQPSPRPCSRRP
jgi:hypothetical protein